VSAACRPCKFKSNSTKKQLSDLTCVQLTPVRASYDHLLCEFLRARAKKCKNMSFLRRFFTVNGHLLKRYLAAAASPRRTLVLGIETSFDETGAAVIDADTGVIVGDSLASTYGRKFDHLYHGVVPGLAAAEHERWLNGIIGDAMSKAKCTFEELSAVGVTAGPGLGLCLQVGLARATFISHSFRIPFIPVNHLEAHVLSARMFGDGRSLLFPFLTLLISGGHSQFALCRGVGDHVLLGGTLDDACGEAFDKVAQLLGVQGGGAAIESLAAQGDSLLVPLPRPLVREASCVMSFSGLKTATMRALHQREPSAKTVTADTKQREPARQLTLDAEASSIATLLPTRSDWALDRMARADNLVCVV
jgi:N6-L-threonylcarbamoyladenine synthase